MTRGAYTDQVALITGVSRPGGIALTLATRLADAGATVYATGWPGHDQEMPWGAADLGPVPFAVEQRDLEDPTAPADLLDAVIDAHGRVDMVLAVHARSSHQSLAEVTVDELDRCWAANVRSIVLLAQHFADRHDPRWGEGRLIWFTSGQHNAPMAGELPYAITKGALHQMTRSLAEALIDHEIVANCVNPGPVDTGWAPPALHADIAGRFPSGRWNTPDDVADLITFLLSDAGSRVVGQVIDLEAGFRRADQGPRGR